MTIIQDVEKGNSPSTYEDRAGHGIDNSKSDSHPAALSELVVEEEHDEIEIGRIPTYHTSKSHSAKNPVIKLAKTLTSRSNASVLDPGPPPDGGRKAWTQAFMGHFVVFNTWGMISTFGVFQQHYTTNLGLEPSAVSWMYVHKY